MFTRGDESFSSSKREKKDDGVSRENLRRRKYPIEFRREAVLADPPLVGTADESLPA